MMGNEMEHPLPPPPQPSRARLNTSMPTFYAINFANDGEPISFYSSTLTGRLELVSIHLPLFDNVSPGLETNQIQYNTGVGATLTCPSGFYNSGADLVIALNAATVVLSWTFNQLTKRVTVSSAGLFSMSDCRLLNLVLGFEKGSIDGSALEYESTQIMNLFPYSHYLVNCDKLITNSFFAENRTISMAIPLDSFDFISGRTVFFDRNSPYHGAMRRFSGNLFPLRITVDVLFIDDTYTIIPLAVNQRYSMTLASYP